MCMDLNITTEKGKECLVVSLHTNRCMLVSLISCNFGSIAFARFTNSCTHWNLKWFERFQALPVFDISLLTLSFHPEPNMRLRNTSMDGPAGSQLFEDTSGAAAGSHTGYRLWGLAVQADVRRDIKLLIQKLHFTHTHSDPALVESLYFMNYTFWMYILSHCTVDI